MQKQKTVSGFEFSQFSQIEDKSRLSLNNNCRDNREQLVSTPTKNRSNFFGTTSTAVKVKDDSQARTSRRMTDLAKRRNWKEEIEQAN